MLVNPKTNRRSLWKYALVLPLLAVLISLTAARERIAKTLASQPTSDSLLTRTGTVFGTNHSALMGAHVVVRNTNRGTETNAAGSFELTDVPATASLVISYVGYKTVQIPVKNHTSFVAVLAVETTGLPEVIVDASAKVIPTTESTHPVSTTNPPNEVFTVVEQSPEFPGGMTGVGQYLGANLRYPIEAQQQRTEGRVFVQFIVAADGSIQNPRVLKGIGNGCDEEAVRVVSTMPKWKPGIQSGHPVNVQFNLPIQFKLGGRQPANPVNPLQEISAPQATTGITPLRTGNLSDEKPLYIIDGEEQPKDHDLNKLKPDAILHINVLKGASAQTKYGEKGKNGVVEITTRAKKP